MYRIWREEGLKVPARQPKRGRLWKNDGDQTPLFIPDLRFSFHNSYLYFESVSSPVQVAYTLSSYAALWYYNEHATSQS